MGPPMHCASPKLKGISPKAILMALRIAGTNALRILHARYSLIGKKRSGVQRVPSAPSGPRMRACIFLLMKYLSRSPPNLLKVMLSGSLVHAIIRLVIQYAKSTIVFFRFYAL